MESDARFSVTQHAQQQLLNESCQSYWDAALYLKVYLLAIFSEDELMSDTLMQYCSERVSHKACVHAHVATCTDQNPQLHRPVKKNDVPEVLIKSQF